MSALITAMAHPIDARRGAPEEMVFLPEGTHTIRPRVDGTAKVVTITVHPERGEVIAAALNRDLERRIKAAAAGQEPRPWFDFDHTPGPKSAEPVSFRYQPGVGILAALKWTAKGKAAVESPDDATASEYDHFSPCCLIDGQGEPVGLPEKGAYGGLVNEPAFRSIPKIAATEDSLENTPITPLNHNTMDTTILAVVGLLTAGEAALPNAADLAQQRVKKLDDLSKPNADALSDRDKEIAALKARLKELEDEKAAAEGEAKDLGKKRADDLIAAATRDGRIAPQDKYTREKYRSRIAAGDAFAEEILAGLPRKFDPSGKFIEVKSGRADESLTGLELVTAALAQEAESASR